MGSAFQAMKKKDIVRDGEGSSRKNVQVKLYFFSAASRIKNSRSQGINIPCALPWCQGSGTQLEAQLWTQWQTALASKGWGLVLAARVPETAFNGKNQEEREKTQVPLRSPSNE